MTNLSGLKVYVAGKWGSRDKLLDLANSLEQQGVTITRKWMVAEVNINHRSSTLCGQLALEDTNAVRAADVVVVVVDDDKYAYRGTFCEIGTAIGANVPVVLYEAVTVSEGCYVDRNIFFHHPHISRVKSWEHVQDMLSTLHKTIQG